MYRTVLQLRVVAVVVREGEVGGRPCPMTRTMDYRKINLNQPDR